MIDLLSYQFFLGIIIGGLLVSTIYPIIFKKKRDLNTLEENLNDIKKTMNDLQGFLVQHLIRVYVYYL